MSTHTRVIGSYAIAVDTQKKPTEEKWQELYEDFEYTNRMAKIQKHLEKMVEEGIITRFRII